MSAYSPRKANQNKPNTRKVGNKSGHEISIETPHHSDSRLKTRT
nr:MAG TPA: hypothetical protein [Inoviridae sp.]